MVKVEKILNFLDTSWYPFQGRRGRKISWGGGHNNLIVRTEGCGTFFYITLHVL